MSTGPKTRHKNDSDFNTRRSQKKLLEWQSGHISADEIHRWAEKRYHNDDFDYDDWEGEEENSVTNEIIAHLDMLNLNLTTDADVGIFLEFLSTPEGPL